MPKKTNKNQNQKKNETEINSKGVIIGTKKKKKANTSKKETKNQKRKEVYHKMIRTTIKWVILTILLIGAILFFLSTPLFHVNTISIIGNSKISVDTIEELSGIQVGENIFQLSKKQIEQNIKQNPYIESVVVKRRLPSNIEITVNERQSTYLIEVGAGFMAINNQGYMLEVLSESNGLPILTGISTRIENRVEGQRLGEQDLECLETVLKIMDTINVKGITEKVTQIDISNKQNYTLTFEEEAKVAYLGDASDISTRILYLKAILGQTKGKTGEIFINGQTDNSNPYFREKI